MHMQEELMALHFNKLSDFCAVDGCAILVGAYSDNVEWYRKVTKLGLKLSKKGNKIQVWNLFEEDHLWVFPS